MPLNRGSSLAVLALAVLACAPETPTSSNADLAPALATQSADVLADRYIVVFRPGTANADRLTTDMARGGTVHFRYRTALQGFAATLPGAALEGIRRNPNVAFVESDAVMTMSATTQSPATWGLDRIDQRALPLSNSYSYDASGAGVHAYIIDTGILSSHVEFGGRVGSGFTAVNGKPTTEDCNGHGTHVSGTVGGSTWGVAKEVTLIPVRVLGCNGSGTTSGVIAGIDWVAANAVLPAVANMSLGGGASTALDNALAAAVDAGITFVVAAGNENADACNSSPARAPIAITVGSTTSSDARSSFSNFGTCLDLFAPGSGITSAWSTSNTATNTISGTSMASPHVAGAAAVYLSANQSASPSQVTAALVNGATTGVVGGAGNGSPNLLLFSGGGGNTPPPPPPPADVVVHVADISAATQTKGKNWSATATIAVVDADGAPVSGATVTGSWNPGGTVSCSTSASGSCDASSPNYRNDASATFTVTGISGSGLTYNAGANAESSITVDRP
jgi:subtilisin family serine protease